ncbi:GLIPR1-like protein 1 [Misgurnus anguillicaudatus]|uniref:GLIPR1-like protein 1 n=1 Tax=Misgurnus anguillicaudatus TaxID=75329 RepID=UPI003CCF7685
MSDSLHFLLRVIVLLHFAPHTQSTEPFYDITDPAFIKECVEEHNRHRANVNPSASNMRYMTWDEGLAISARAWASNCFFEHNPNLQQPGKMHPIFTPVGENLWAGAPYGSFKVQSAIQSWVNEDQYYNYKSNGCSKVCGHYTQVVWADSYKVGCAAQACQNGVAEFSSAPGIIFVCNYATAGNYPGVSPYKKGKSCSGCATETCENNLCRNSTRDTQKRYNWRPDWDPALSTCGSFCASLLIIRPVSIVFIFISVFCLQRFYPNLFIYE